uniref:SAND domain-containing protein n=1 Tax=Strongyloides papillosus TaxID=174720 RepID=A0A0N5BXI3_STREA
MKSDSDDSNFGNHIDITTAFTNQTRVDLKHCDLGIKDKKFLEVRCGTLYGTLHLDKFLCPGIHCKCIEHEGVLITPRHFTVQAQKDKQKDWKGSIRIGRYNLRTLMEMKVIDFYEHEIRCSLKCHSRNYIKNSRKMLSDSLQELENATKLLQTSEISTTPSETKIKDDEILHTDGQFEKNSSQILLDFMTKNLHPSPEDYLSIEKISNIEPKTSDSPTSSINHQSTSSIITDSSTSSEVSVTSSATQQHQQTLPTVSTPQINNFINAILEQQKQLQMAAVISANTSRNTNINNFTHTSGNIRSNFDHVKKVMESSPAEFWIQMKRLGILEDLLNVISVSVENVKRVYLAGASLNTEYAAIRLSKLASSLDLGDLFGQRIHARYLQTTLESNLLANNNNNNSNNNNNTEFIDLQRKMANLTGHNNIGGNIFLGNSNPLKRKNMDTIFGDKLFPNQYSSIFSTINPINNNLTNLAFIESLKRQRLDNK